MNKARLFSAALAGAVAVSFPLAAVAVAQPHLWKVPTQTEVKSSTDVAVDRAGKRFDENGALKFKSVSFITTDGTKIMRVSLDGKTEHLAGTDAECPDGEAPCDEGGKAVDARFTSIQNVSVAPSGDLYLYDEASHENGFIRAISKQDGIVRTIYRPETDIAVKGSDQRIRISPWRINVNHAGELIVFGHIDDARQTQCVWQYFLDPNTNEWTLDLLAGGGNNPPAVSQSAQNIDIDTFSKFFETRSGFGVIANDFRVVLFDRKADGTYAVKQVGSLTTPRPGDRPERVVQDHDGSLLVTNAVDVPVAGVGMTWDSQLLRFNAQLSELSAITQPRNTVNSEPIVTGTALSQALLGSDRLLVPVPGGGSIAIGHSSDNDIHYIGSDSDSALWSEVESAIRTARSNPEQTATLIRKLQKQQDLLSNGSRKVIDQQYALRAAGKARGDSQLSTLPRELIGELEKFQDGNEAEQNVQSMQARAALAHIEQELVRDGLGSIDSYMTQNGGKSVG